MSRELSVSCFDDRCDDCYWPLCECRCHDDEEFDLVDGWQPTSGEASDVG